MLSLLFIENESAYICTLCVCVCVCVFICFPLFFFFAFIDCFLMRNFCVLPLSICGQGTVFFQYSLDFNFGFQFAYGRLRNRIWGICALWCSLSFLEFLFVTNWRTFLCPIQMFLVFFLQVQNILFF